MAQKNMNHSEGQLKQRNLNLIFAIVIVILLVAVSYLVGLVHLSYRNELKMEKVQMMQGNQLK
jgi:hypothetical protein